MTDDEIAEAVKMAVLPIMRRLPSQERRGECASFTAALGYELMRGIHGDEFAREWLEAALTDLNTSPPRVVLREFQ